jgi:hypothetical protein
MRVLHAFRHSRNVLGVTALFLAPLAQAQRLDPAPSSGLAAEVVLYGPAEMILDEAGQASLTSEPFDGLQERPDGSAGGLTLLVVQNGLPSIEPLPQASGAATTSEPGGSPAAEHVVIKLNGAVVLEAGAEDGWLQQEVALAPSGNVLEATASGPAGAVVVISVVAEVAEPPNPIFSGSAMLAWASAAEGTHTSLALANAGAAELSFQVSFFEPDGTSAGQIEPRTLAPGASTSLDLGLLAQGLGSSWSAGSVRVDWTSEGWTQLIGYATESRSGTAGCDSARTIPLVEVAASGGAVVAQNPGFQRGIPEVHPGKPGTRVRSSGTGNRPAAAPAPRPRPHRRTSGPKAQDRARPSQL